MATVTAAPEPSPAATGMVDLTRSVQAGNWRTLSAAAVRVMAALSG